MTDPENFPDTKRVLMSVALAQRAQPDAAGIIIGEVETVTAVKAETAQMSVGPEKNQTMLGLEIVSWSCLRSMKASIICQ